MTHQVEKTDEEWRKELTPEEYAVLRQAGTERAFTGQYTDTETKGVYRCKACQAKLFESDTKFHSGCGWPSFYQPITDTIEYIEDNSHGMKRVEVRCANCGSHLGHVFPDGYGTPTGDRYCINSISLTLEPADEAPRTSPRTSRRAQVGAHPGHVLVEVDPRDQLAAAAHVGLVEDRLQVVLDGVRRHVQRRRDLLGVDALQHQPGDVALAAGEPEGGHHQGHDLRGPGLLDGDDHVAVAVGEGRERRGVQHQPQATGATDA